jgi:hypothetical protein
VLRLTIGLRDCEKVLFVTSHPDDEVFRAACYRKLQLIHTLGVVTEPQDCVAAQFLELSELMTLSVAEQVIFFAPAILSLRDARKDVSVLSLTTGTP